MVYINFRPVFLFLLILTLQRENDIYATHWYNPELCQRQFTTSLSQIEEHLYLELAENVYENVIALHIIATPLSWAT